jgi:sarcosine oxidase, subunit beta
MKTANVVVIGGGINGCCTAHSLAKRGVRNVLLVEKGHIASGPTGRSSGVIRQHYTHETLASMARDSIQVWNEFDERIGGDAGFVRCGVVFFASEKQTQSLRSTAEMMRRIGIRTAVMSRGELVKMEPMLFADDIECGVYEPDGGYADPALAANSFAEAAKRLGVEVMQRTTVLGLRIEHDAIRAVVTDHGEISTDCVVNVAGPWGPEIAAMAGVHIPIVPSNHPVVILERPASWSGATPCWGDLINGWYFKPEKSAGIMVGSIQDIRDDGPRDMEDFPTKPSYAEIEDHSAGILKRFPIMKNGLAHGGWCGVYDVTPDWQPVIDKIGEVQGFYCAVGFSGHGFKIAPAVGQVVSELVLDGGCSAYDIHMFRCGRFAEKQSSRGNYKYGIVG